MAALTGNLISSLVMHKLGMTAVFIIYVILTIALASEFLPDIMVVILVAERRSATLPTHICTSSQAVLHTLLGRLRALHPWNHPWIPSNPSIYL